MNNKDFESLKDIYLDVEVTKKSVNKSWDLVEQRLPRQDVPMPFIFPRYAYLAVIFIGLVLLGTVTLAQTSNPGETLYPVKVLSEKVTKSVLPKSISTQNVSVQKVTPTATPSATLTPPSQTPHEEGNDDKPTSIPSKNENHDDDDEEKSNSESFFSPLINSHKKSDETHTSQVEGAATTNQDGFEKKDDSEGNDHKNENQRKNNDHQEK